MEMIPQGSNSARRSPLCDGGARSHLPAARQLAIKLFNCILFFLFFWFSVLLSLVFLSFFFSPAAGLSLYGLAHWWTEANSTVYTACGRQALDSAGKKNPAEVNPEHGGYRTPSCFDNSCNTTVVAMPGIKRRVETASDRDGKRAKVKDATTFSAAKGGKKNYLPPSFQKKGITRGSRKMNRDKKLAKAAQKNTSSNKVQRKKQEEVDDDDDDEDDSEDSDSADDSDIEMDDEQDAIEEEQGDEESEDEDLAELSGNGEHSNNTENSMALFHRKLDTALTLLLYLQKVLLVSLMPNKGPLPRNARRRNPTQILSHDRRNYGNDFVASPTCLVMSARHWSPNSTKSSPVE